MIRILLTLIFIITSNCIVCSQIVETNDSIMQSNHSGLTDEDIEELKSPLNPDNPFYNQEAIKPEDITTIKSDADLHDLVPAPQFEELPASLVLKNEEWMPQYPLPYWSSGYIYGGSSASNSLLYGYIASAQMGIEQRMGRYWKARAQFGLQKNSIYYNTASASGEISWQPSPYFALTAFGAYSPGSFLSPINIGTSFHWGGYITLQTDTAVPFGIDLGARQTYDSMFGHELVPIVQPFVKFGNSKIGIDLGPMIKEATRKNHHDGNGFTPIPQPIKAIPQVAPRR